jgi:hypothetical protein
MNPIVFKEYRRNRRLGVPAFRALRIARGQPAYSDAERAYQRGKIAAIYSGMPPYDPEELKKIRRPTSPLAPPFSGILSRMLYGGACIGCDTAFHDAEKSVNAVYQREGMKFIVEVPEGYEARFHTGIGGTTVVAVKEDGGLPHLYLHQDGEKFSWKDHSPNQPLKILVEAENK